MKQVTQPLQKKSQYPECEKIAKIQAQSQVIGEFLDWANSEHGIQLASYEKHEALVVKRNIWLVM